MLIDAGDGKVITFGNKYVNAKFMSLTDEASDWHVPDSMFKK
jgi:hypothetical protein